MRHGTCFRRRLSARHAGAAPHSAVAELGVVRRLHTLFMNGSQLSLPLRAHLASLLACSVAGCASLAASANGSCSRERRNARHVSASRRGEGVSKVCMSAASLTPEAFGDSYGLRRRFVWRDSGKWPSERQTPNQALQRTAGFGGQFPGTGSHPPGSVTACAPATNPGTARACASRRPAHTTAPGPQSLSLGSLGDSHHVS